MKDRSSELDRNMPGRLKARTDVFISYAREDKEFVTELRNHLEEAGLSVWIDESSIPPGSSFLEVIYDGIEGSSALLAILSKNFQESRFCRLEIEHARKFRKRMVPVKRVEVNKDAIDPELSRFNWVDCSAERPFLDGAEECVDAIRLDMNWATRGVRFLQMALDWERKNADLLGRSGVRELSAWLNESEQEKRDVSSLVRRYFKFSRAALRRSMLRLGSAIILTLAILVGIPLYVASTTPSSAWMSTDLDSVNANDAVVTAGVGEVERLWMRRDLGEVHHPNPYEAEDDVFESKHAIYELSLGGKLISEATYFLELYSGESWRVGDFRFGDDSNAPRSALANELISRFQSSPKEIFRENKASLWSTIAQPTAMAAHMMSVQGDLEMKNLSTVQANGNRLISYFQSEILKQRNELVNDEYPNHLTDIEVFRLRSGVWLAFIQLMNSGKKYDLGILPARSEDKGLSWTLGSVIPRLAEGNGFHFNAQSIRAVVEDEKGDIWVATEYNLSRELGHPSGAPGQLARSSNGGLSWRSIKLPNPLDSCDSFTGIAASRNSPGLIALSIEDRNATSDTSGPRLWLSNDYGETWQSIEEGLNVDPLSRVRVIWVGAGPRLVALQELQDGTVRPIVFRSLSFLERLRGRVGIDRRW